MNKNFCINQKNFDEMSAARIGESPRRGRGGGSPGGRCPPVGRKGGSPAGNKVSARRADGAIYFLPFDFVKREKVTKRENRPGGISIFPPGPPFKNDQLGGCGPLLETPPGVSPGSAWDESVLCSHTVVWRALGTELTGACGRRYFGFCAIKPHNMHFARIS